MLIERLVFGGPNVGALLESVDLLEHVATAFDVPAVDAGRQRDVSDAEVLEVGVGVDLEGVVFGAQVAGGAAASVRSTSLPSCTNGGIRVLKPF